MARMLSSDTRAANASPFARSRWLLHTLLLGAVGAGMVHIAVLLLLPSFSDNSVWSRVAAAMDPYEPARLDRPGIPGIVISNPDPLFQTVGCRFNLDDGLIRFQTEGEVPYWSVSIYDRVGANVYSFNDRSSANGNLDFVVLTPAQTSEVRREVPTELQASSFIETDAAEGLAVIRAFVPDDTWVPAANAFLGGLTCKPV